MADTMAARLMATMRGDDSRYEAPEPKADATTLALLRQGRDEDTAQYAATVHKSNAEARQEHERAVRKRAQELRAQGVHHPESTARMELHIAAQRRSEQDERRAVYEAMTRNNRAEMEANSTAGLRDRIKASTAQRREENTKRLVASLMAQLQAST
ncbi:hypothetical protein QCN29_06235 [Streptomyces sp. HNM0663]|uniref:Uncharacterized protein n=1 Tax=Streptomyces chengmaiensis TaxID=3040919 RepID=A0ABT6HK04_9ACTN|nr:hypothetical protein [Streptomyces chengmaiensis]MDH2388389.1 hypothetical protein [Streptomyces chengmaiensis]